MAISSLARALPSELKACLRHEQKRRQNGKTTAYLELLEVLVDVLHVFAAEHGVVIIVRIHVLDFENIGERLAQVVRRAARSLHGGGGHKLEHGHGLRRTSVQYGEWEHNGRIHDETDACSHTSQIEKLSLIKMTFL